MEKETFKTAVSLNGKIELITRLIDELQIQANSIVFMNDMGAVCAITTAKLITAMKHEALLVLRNDLATLQSAFDAL